MEHPRKEQDPPALDARGAEIHVYLDHVLQAPAFAAAPRRGRLLRYLLEQTLAGDGDKITEYGIGLDVFEKPSSFDPRIESSIRAEMSRLRRTLADYYAGAGSADPWRIEFPNRGYLPVIAPLAVQEAPAVSLATPESLSSQVRAGRRSRFWFAAACAAALCAVALWFIQPWSGPIRAVVVLPFENLTGDPQKEYLADGVTEQLTDALAHIPSLRVVARTSAFQYKAKGIDVRKIGRQLDVDAVVEGSVQAINGGLRVTVQVDRSSNGYHILSQSFDGGLQELARLEDLLVAPVAGALSPSAAVPKRHIPNPQAYDAFLKSRSYRGQGTINAFQDGIRYLNLAIEKDPNYTDAYAALAGVYASGAANFATTPLEFVPHAKAAAAKALELDPQCAGAFAAEGYLDAMILLDWKGGESKLRTAIRLMPNDWVYYNWLGNVLLAQGRFSEALAELRTADQSDPLAGGPGVTVGNALYMARRYDDALRQFLKVQTLHPDLIAVHAFTGTAWEAKGDFAEAVSEYNLVLPKAPYLVRERIVHLLAITGKREEARRMLQELEHPKPDQQAPDAFSMAILHTALGERDEAFDWLNRALDQRKVAFIKVHPMLDPLRNDPRFPVLLAKAGLAN
jgi:serine/threonine-protein kinase